MDNAPGELYVISEKDVMTGERTHYYKCGIVRGGTGRGTDERLLEHQTGNPRRLFIVESFLSPSVEFVETSIHHRWASKRVNGEWFRLDERELTSLLESIKSFIAEVTNHEEVFAQSKELQKINSNGVILPVSTEAKQWFTHYQNYKLVFDKCEQAIARYQELLREAVASGVNISAVATQQKRNAPKSFSEKLFAENFPDIYKTYTQIEYVIQGSFRFAQSKEILKVSEKSINDSICLIEDFEKLLQSDFKTEDFALALHEKHLVTLEIRNHASWQFEIARAKLRVITGEYDGIESICSWKRTEVEKKNFDRASVQKEFPAEYESCIVEGKSSEAMVIKPMQSGHQIHLE